MTSICCDFGAIENCRHSAHIQKMSGNDGNFYCKQVAAELILILATIQHYNPVYMEMMECFQNGINTGSGDGRSS